MFFFGFMMNIIYELKLKRIMIFFHSFASFVAM